MRWLTNTLLLLRLPLLSNFRTYCWPQVRKFAHIWAGHSCREQNLVTLCSHTDAGMIGLQLKKMEVIKFWLSCFCTNRSKWRGCHRSVSSHFFFIYFLFIFYFQVQGPQHLQCSAMECSDLQCSADECGSQRAWKAVTENRSTSQWDWNVRDSHRLGLHSLSGS